MSWLPKRGRALVNFALAIMMVVLYIAITTPQAKSAISELYNNPVYRGHKKGVVALECAVSWNAEALPAMLDTLKAQEVAITFHVSGEWAQENQELLRRMVREGHEIGTMGASPQQDGGADAVTEDVERSIAYIHQLCGVKPVLYYSGARDVAASSRAAARLGLTHVLCTVDLLSGRGSAENILLRALDKPFDGSIILIQPTAEAAKALPACINGLRQQGYRITTVGDALG